MLGGRQKKKDNLGLASFVWAGTLGHWSTRRDAVAAVKVVCWLHS